jgi:acyl transferase domain-containing protein
MESAPQNPPPGASAIAIVGMAGRFPGAADVRQFWHNLVAGVESITFFTADQLRAAGVTPQTLADPAFVGARSVRSAFRPRRSGSVRRRLLRVEPA